MGTVTALKPKANANSELTWAGRVPRIKPGTYSDGVPYNDLNYLSFKLVLTPNQFSSRESFFDFANVLKKPAKQHGVKLSTKGYRKEPLKIREVLFMDTKDFRLYNNAFILRRRIPYQDGFPIGDPEIVFKFRNSNIQQAAATDVRPKIQGTHRVKFKVQALPLKERLGGMRMLYSHNVQFPRSQANVADALAVDVITEAFPVLAPLLKPVDGRLELVSDTIVEEVLQDIGELDFGDGINAKVDVGIWRTRGEHRPLIAEFAYQIKFKDRKELALDAMKRAEAFFYSLQFAAKDSIALKSTKTGLVYRLHGNPPKSHE